MNILKVSVTASRTRSVTTTTLRGVGFTGLSGVHLHSPHFCYIKNHSGVSYSLVHTFRSVLTHVFLRTGLLPVESGWSYLVIGVGMDKKDFLIELRDLLRKAYDD